MNFLEERIVKDGVVRPGNVLKVDSFLNHQMDVSLLEEIGREFIAGLPQSPLTLTPMLPRWSPLPTRTPTR